MLHYELVCVEISSGIDGIEYSRSYYFDNGCIYFAFLDGTDSQRLYYFDNQLIRWLYASAGSGNKITHDMEFSDSEYCYWGDLARSDASKYL